MKRNPMLAIGIAAVFIVTAGSAQAQTSEPTTPSQSKEPNAITSPQPKTPNQQAKTPNQADEKFIKEAIQGDMMEVKMGQLAQEKGASEAVKKFGQTLVNDHGAHQKKAEQLAQSMGITPPTELTTQQQAIYDKLSKLSGADFDKQFAQAMVRDHREDILDFLKEARKSGATASFAKETLPTLRKHLQTARGLTQQKTTTGSSR